jgi:membrane associated rhomboid family serine protease
LRHRALLVIGRRLVGKARRPTSLGLVSVVIHWSGGSREVGRLGGRFVLGDGERRGGTVRAMVLPLRDLNPTKRVPVVTLLIIALNIFVYFALQPHGDAQESNRFVYDHAVIPCEIVHGHPLTQKQIAIGSCSVSDRDVLVQTNRGLVRVPAEPLAPHKNVYLSVIVSMFLHANLFHLLGNMLFLWIFGNNVEDHLRPFSYLLFYFAAGIVATVAFIAVNADSVSPLVGASGAIAGVMGAYLIWFPRARILSVVLPLFFFPFYLPAAVVLAVWFVTQFFTDPNTGVAWVAHVSGFAFGALIALALRDTRGPMSRYVPPPPPLPGAWPGGLRGLE